MNDEYDHALAQIDEYWKSIMTLARLTLDERSSEIEHLGRSLKELSKMTIPDLDDKEHNPFDGMIYIVNVNEPQNVRDERNKSREEQKIKLLVDFCKRKKSQIEMLKEKRKSSTNSVPISSPKEKEHHWWNNPMPWIGIGVTVILSIIGWLVYT